MKTIKIIFATVTAMLLLSSNSLVADGAQPFHVTYQIGGANLDGDRDTRDGDPWQAIGIGWFWGNNFSIDLEYDHFEGDYRSYDVAVPGATFDKWRLSTTQVVGRYYISDRAWRPYLLAGLGSTKHGSVLDEGSNSSWSYGFGLQGQMAKHWSVRAQLMWRQDNDGSSLPAHNSYGDLMYSLGLSFDFGGKTPPPPPPPPPAAAPPPPPPNPDLDGDGVPNERDKCPNTRPGAVVDMDGCEVEAVISLEGVHFDFDKATLRPEAKVILDNAAALLQSQERVVVEVAGHTDSVGTEAYNQGLSERRANSVKDYLTSKGVKASRLTARGYGEVQPVASNDTDAGRQANRRVELIVLDR